MSSLSLRPSMIRIRLYYALAVSPNDDGFQRGSGDVVKSLWYMQAIASLKLPCCNQ